MSLFDGATATSPMQTVASRSNWCSKVVPLLVVLSSPPEAVATQYVVGSASFTANATIRPLMLAGPIARQVKALTQSAGRPPLGLGAVGSLAGAAGRGARSGGWLPAGPVRDRATRTPRGSSTQADRTKRSLRAFIVASPPVGSDSDGRVPPLNGRGTAAVKLKLSEN